MLFLKLWSYTLIASLICSMKHDCIYFLFENVNALDRISDLHTLGVRWLEIGLSVIKSRVMVIGWLAHYMIPQKEVEIITRVSVLGLIIVDSELNNIYSKCALLIISSFQ